MSVLFKQINQEGVTTVEFMLWRNGVDFMLIQFFLWPRKINPFSKSNFETAEKKGLLKYVLLRT